MKRFLLRCLLAVLIVSTSYSVLWWLQAPDDALETVQVSREWIAKVQEERLAQRARVRELEETLQQMANVCELFQNYGGHKS